jgi:hypothetical protein
MSENTVSVLFSVLRSVICGAPMSDAEKALVTEENLPKLMNPSFLHPKLRQFFKCFAKKEK